MQVVITPIHLLGLNLYNVPSATTAERFRSVASTYPEATGVRMLRFLWAFGVGGLVNNDLTQRARDWTVHQYSVEVPLERKKSFFDGVSPADGIRLTLRILGFATFFATGVAAKLTGSRLTDWL